MARTSEHSEQKPGPEGGGRQGEPAPRLSLPAVHLPCLILVGLLGLTLGVWPFVDMHDEVVNGVLMGAFLLAAGLHVVWVYRLFRDGRRVLGGALVLDERRAAVVLVASAVFAQIWTAVALGFLLRVAYTKVHEAEPARSTALGRYAAEARTLFWMGFLSLGVFLVQLLMIRSELDLYGRQWESEVESQVEILGLVPSIIFSLFHMTITAYYLNFAARSIPALYRSYRALKERDLQAV